MGLEDCIFCQIANGKLESKTVYEDSKCRAVLDIHPANGGHVLLMPKEHHVIWQLLPDDLASHLALVSKDISRAMLKALGVQGVNIHIANGEAAGQKAPHFIMHIIPRMKDDGINFQWTPKEIKEDDAKTVMLMLQKEIE